MRNSWLRYGVKHSASVRCIAPGLSVRRQSYAPWSATWRGHRDRSGVGHKDDAADGIEAIHHRPYASRSADGHKVYRIPSMARGFVYLTAVVDWFSRRCWLGECRSQWRRSISAWTQQMRRSPGMAVQGTSIPTKAVSSPAPAVG